MNQAERLESLMAHCARADHGAILRVIDEELRMLRAMAILAFGATRDPNMRVMRSVATALRAIVGGPPTVSPAPPKHLRRLYAEATALPARNTNEREAKKKALAEATAKYARWERNTPAGRLTAGATEACMRLGLAWDARPFKLSRPEVRLRLINLCEDALGREYGTASPEQRAAWVESTSSPDPVVTERRSRPRLGAWKAIARC